MTLPNDTCHIKVIAVVAASQMVSVNPTALITGNWINGLKCKKRATQVRTELKKVKPLELSPGHKIPFFFTLHIYWLDHLWIYKNKLSN